VHEVLSGDEVSGRRLTRKLDKDGGLEGVQTLEARERDPAGRKKPNQLRPTQW
jgi:hypothetical protein